MSALGRYLSRGLDVRLASPIEAVLCGDDEGTDRPGCDGPWRARPALQGVAGAVEGAAEFAAQAMVLTAPVPQSLALLDAGGVVLADTDRAMLERIAYDPCLALLATLDGPSRLPPPGALEPAAGPLGWIADNHAKGVSRSRRRRSTPRLRGRRRTGSATGTPSPANCCAPPCPSLASA